MRYSAIFLLFVSTGLSFLGCGVPSAQPTEITVMAWNIWHGGNDESLPVDDGRPIVIDIIRRSGADIVLMIETYGAAEMIAGSLGFEYFLISSNLCVFSRFPITNRYSFEQTIAPFNFGGAQIALPDSTHLNVFDTWLHYLPDTRLVPLDSSPEEIIEWETEGSRDEEIRAVLEAMDPFLRQADSIPVILGGDFNSHSHLDWTEATKDTFHHGGVVVPWPISSMILEAGLIDSYRRLLPDPTTHPGVTWLSDLNGGYGRMDRIDYLYHKGARIRAISSEIFNAPDGQEFEFRGERFIYPSDHGFVLTTFQIEGD